MKEAGPPADASSLIYLAKADAMAISAQILGPLVAVPAVWSETVVAGLRLGKPDAAKIQRAAEVGWMRRVQLTPTQEQSAGRLAAAHGLGRGESEALALASTEVLIDEGRGTKVARQLGLLPISTLFLPVVGLQRGVLGRRGALSLLRRIAPVTGVRADAVFVIERHLGGT
jgi:predicted nucleic acid-binding protein